MLRSPIQGEPLRWWEVVRKSLLLGRPGGPGSRFRAFPTPGRSVGRVQTLGPLSARHCVVETLNFLDLIEKSPGLSRHAVTEAGALWYAILWLRD
jgi:hypothetical protein